MIWKIPDSFETIRKMGNDLERSRQLSGFSVIRAKTFRMRKNFPGSNATLLPRFLRLWGLVHSVFVGVIDFVGGSVSLERWGWGCLLDGVVSSL